jgi:hypothetical protein
MGVEKTSIVYDTFFAALAGEVVDDCSTELALTLSSQSQNSNLLAGARVGVSVSTSFLRLRNKANGFASSD